MRFVQTDFSKGIVTDVIGVPGACYESRDMIVDRGGEIRSRGGRYTDTLGPTTTNGAICYGGASVKAAAGGDDYIAYCFSDGSTGQFGFFSPGDSAQTYTSCPDPGSLSSLSLSAMRAGRLFSHNGEVFSNSFNPSRSSTGALAWYPIRYGGCGDNSAVGSDFTLDTTGFIASAATITASVPTGGVGTRLYTKSGTAAAGWNATDVGRYVGRSGMSGYVGADFYGRVLQKGTNTLLLDANVGSSDNEAWSVAPIAPYVCVAVHTSAQAKTDGSPFSSAPGTTNDATAYVNAGVGCSHIGRVFVGNTGEHAAGYCPHRVRYSGLFNDVSSNTYSQGVTYYPANGFFDVHPGIGDYITGLASFNGKLIILKDTGVFVLNGAVDNTSPTKYGATIDVVSDTVGASSCMSYAVTPAGVVFCDENGVYLYDGTSLRNLTDGRCSRAWQESLYDGTTTGSYGYASSAGLGCYVSCVNDRVIFSNPQNAAASTNNYGLMWSYDLSRDSFTQMTSTPNTMPSVVTKARVYDEQSAVRSAFGGRWRPDAEIGLPGSSRSGNTNIYTHFESDYLSTARVDSGTYNSYDCPRPKISTHPFNLSGDDMSLGRPNVVYVNHYLADTGDAGTEAISVELLMGRLGYDDAAEAAVYVGNLSVRTTDSSIHLGVGAISNNLYSHGRVRLSFTPSTQGKGVDWRLFGIAVDTKEAGRAERV